MASIIVGYMQSAEAPDERELRPQRRSRIVTDGMDGEARELAPQPLSNT